jgi:hypothetical protein
MKLNASLPVFYALIILVLSAMSLPINKISLVDAKVVDHVLWDNVLQEHVSESGKVDYKRISESEKFTKYLEELSEANPFAQNWTRKDRLSFWLNAYNALTVSLIVDNNLNSSIKEIKHPWAQKFFSINNKKMSLGEIEHEILRKQKEPRIHFALVCASLSCPNLLNQAYLPTKLESQLSIQAKQFINDNNKNNLDINELSLSKIFKWFRSDFTSENDLIYFINQYSEVKINTNAKISFRNYDWNLNN